MEREGSKKREKQQRQHQSHRRRRRCSRSWSRYSMQTYIRDGFPDRNCSLWRANIRTKKEIAVERNCCVLTVTSHPPLRYREVWRTVMKLVLKMWGEKVVVFFNVYLFVFRCLNLISVDNKLISTQAESVSPTTLISEQSPCLYLNLHAFLFLD